MQIFNLSTTSHLRRLFKKRKFVNHFFKHLSEQELLKDLLSNVSFINKASVQFSIVHELNQIINPSKTSHGIPIA